jgi:DNA mismatch repair protein MutS2
MEKLRRCWRKKQKRAKKEDGTDIKIKTKLESYQELYDSNQKIYVGQKIEDNNRYFKQK